MKNQSRYENIAYLVLWGMLFASPLLSFYVRSVSDTSLEFHWHELFLVWQQFAIFLALFLVHNFLLAPLLVHERKRVLYFSITGAIVTAFIAYQCTSRPDIGKHGPKPMDMEVRMHDGPKDFMDEEPKHFMDEEPRERMGYGPHDQKHFDKRDMRHRRHKPPIIIGEHDIISIVILILMFGMNLGIKYYFKTRHDQKKLSELERQNLEQQLEYLKYQINPHFFMNTLNNIHVLVDIDPQKAQHTILELSKMMRFILYEGNKQGVPLSREFDFIRNYITLMSLRYTDKVKISVNLPTEVPDRQIPPLMLITFIENAFKHGISYQHESFIEIHVGVGKDRLQFICRNSKAEIPNQEKGGVGLANVKQRLKLLYGNNFTLHIENEPDVYQVELDIPFV